MNKLRNGCEKESTRERERQKKTFRVLRPKCASEKKNVLGEWIVVKQSTDKFYFVWHQKLNYNNFLYIFRFVIRFEIKRNGFSIQCCCCDDGTSIMTFSRLREWERWKWCGKIRLRIGRARENVNASTINLIWLHRLLDRRNCENFLMKYKQNE